VDVGCRGEWSSFNHIVNVCNLGKFRELERTGDIKCLLINTLYIYLDLACIVILCYLRWETKGRSKQ
jgi:hypothetical protein